MKSIIALAVAMALLSLAQCRDTPPTEDECIRSLENGIRLILQSSQKIPETLDQEQIKKMAPLCVEKKKRRIVLCEINAKSMPELHECSRK